MSGRAVSVIAGLGIALSASAAAAQSVASPPMTAEQKQTRYEVGVMEQVLESAVEHGATVTLDRLQAVLPAQMGPAENARVRGFRLDGYGVFFDVEVPSLDGTLDGTLLWSLQTLDQNDLGLQNALKTLKEHLDAEHDPNLQQALKRVELQVAPVGAMARLAETSAAPVRPPAGSAAARQAAEAKKVTDPILDAQESYHKEVMQAIMDAMLEHSGPLAIAPDEWLTIAARGHRDRPRLAPADSDSRTFLMRLNGATLKAFRAAQITKEDALRRIEVRVF